MISVGIMTGAVGINVSHELVHRPNKWERFLGKTLLWTVFYTHWAVEHVFGHHRYVATPRDPATSRLGESVYAFLPRSIIGGFASAWRIEAARLTRLKLRTWHPRNQILQGLALQIGLAAFFGVVFGPLAIVYYLAQSLVGVSLLEVVNYIEHYGLARREIAEGRFEQVTPLHSWNASHVVTNYFLFHLQRHSDHHAAPLRRYQILRHFDESPQLPAGYAAMVVIALIPPLWYRLMNPRVHDHRAKLAATEAAA
ncbi:MAG: alkane 1-monooxygenase [Deltaproteobacteria bacterium]|nr:alkane 1-monooxygenase [Deltaproteobacteria bacterium]